MIFFRDVLHRLWSISFSRLCRSGKGGMDKRASFHQRETSTASVKMMSETPIWVTRLKERIDEGCNSRALRKHNQTAKNE